MLDRFSHKEAVPIHSYTRLDWVLKEDPLVITGQMPLSVVQPTVSQHQSLLTEYNTYKH